jgi:acyl-coenzyme A thioesterase PaaI-like protein
VVVTDQYLNYFRGVHGGLITTLVDKACFFPAPLLPSGRKATTTNLNVTYLLVPSGLENV